MGTHFFLIRHGETVWNLENRFQGQRDSPLSDKGRQQAQRLGEHFKEIEIQALYSSDLGRAVGTAEPIAASKSLPLQTMASLRERSFGIFEGRCREEARAENPEAFEAWNLGSFSEVVPGGESRQNLCERVIEGLENIAAAHQQQSVAVVTHGGVLSSLWRYFEPSRQEQQGFLIPNGSISQLSYSDQGQWQVLNWSKVDHLEH
jgi:probable phosphoglycerate mutase